MNSSELSNLVSDVVQLCGSEKPIWMNPDAPVLKTENDHSSLYLIGVIGGKDVGKSSLINALIGETLAGVSNIGEGTSKALAYVHQADREAARVILDELAPDQYQIILHERPEGKSRLLLDLPDIDSIWNSHVELTRKLLKRMLFPIWVQSVEKYADSQPLQLLSQVAAGNSPENFVFVLTKCDQLATRHGTNAVTELASDYSARVARICGISKTPKVLTVNTKDRSAFDLPELLDLVMSARSQGQVNRSIELARKHRDLTMIDWLKSQGVSQRLESLVRLEESVKDRINDRLTLPLVDQLATRLEKDGSLKSRIIEPIIRSRLSYWPIINVIDATLGPIVAAVSSTSSKPLAAKLAERSVARHVQGVFAELSQQDSRIFDYYQHQKLWEQSAADLAANRIEEKLERAVELHQESLLKTSARPALLTRIIAPIVTIGAALWFPIIQPISEIYLQQTTFEMTRQSMLLIVQLLGASYLIKSIGFLAIYFAALWMYLRWYAGNRMISKLQKTTASDHPAREIFKWSDELALPVTLQIEKIKKLHDRIEAVSIPSRSAA